MAVEGNTLRYVTKQLVTAFLQWLMFYPVRKELHVELRDLFLNFAMIGNRSMAVEHPSPPAS